MAVWPIEWRSASSNFPEGTPYSPALAAHDSREPTRPSSCYGACVPPTNSKIRIRVAVRLVCSLTLLVAIVNGSWFVDQSTNEEWGRSAFTDCYKRTVCDAENLKSLVFDLDEQETLTRSEKDARAAANKYLWVGLGFTISAVLLAAFFGWSAFRPGPLLLGYGLFAITATLWIALHYLRMNADLAELAGGIRFASIHSAMWCATLAGVVGIGSVYVHAGSDHADSAR